MTLRKLLLYHLFDPFKVKVVKPKVLQCGKPLNNAQFPHVSAKDFPVCPLPYKVEVELSLQPVSFYFLRSTGYPSV